jgi:putative hemolysin
METSLFLGIGSAISLVLTAFFTFAETALLSCDRFYLTRKKKEGVRGASLALRLLENLDALLSATQFGSNLFIAAATTFATIIVRQAGIEDELWVFIILAPFTLIFSDSIPKVIGRSFPERSSLYVSAPLFFFLKLFAPFLYIISLYTTKLSKLAGLGRQDALSRRKRTREELQTLLSENDEGSEIRQGHKRLIKRILDFSQHNVKKVMLPFVNVDAINKDVSIQAAIDMFETLRHSRLPVYDERIDNIVGVLYFSDAFRCEDSQNERVSQYMRPALFVPEVQQLETLTREMQNAEMAIVVDEYGGAVGIVTREDVLEEIVGDISDEWDENELGSSEISDGHYLVHGNMGISELNEKLKIHVPKGEYETLSGFLLQQFNRIPAAGDELYFANFKVRVHRASEKAIETVIIEVQPSTEEEEPKP